MRIKKQVSEWIALGLYSLLNIIMTTFHEPWFDEAETWLIARDASYYDILFVRPHFEGHPSIWHLILSIPAKSGLPYELSIKMIQFLIALVMVYIVIFLSPFPRYVRLFLPFSYFFFYQYGVIARPYALFCIAIFLSAMFWKERDLKPWRVTLSLLLLCLSSAYGIVIAGGMTLVWLIESYYSEKKSFWDNRRRIASWSVLLLFAFAIIWQIIPAKDAYALIIKGLIEEHGFIWLFLFFWFVIPSEVVITSCSEYGYVFCQRIDTFSFLGLAVVSTAIWIMLIYVCKSRKKIALLIVPYLLLSIVAAGGYFYIHHYGIVLALFVCILWICFDESPMSYVGIRGWIDSILTKSSIGFKRFVAISTYTLCILLIGINLIWSVVSFVSEIKYNYSFGRDMARFIIDNDLKDYKWFGAWEITRDREDYKKILFEDNTETNVMVTPVNPYFSDNLIYNSPKGITYVTHKVSDPKLAEEMTTDRWRGEEPDFIVATVSDFKTIESALNISTEYTQLEVTQSRTIWKADPFPDYPTYIYVRKDLFERLKLPARSHT